MGPLQYPPKYSFLPGHGWIAQLMNKLPANVRKTVSATIARLNMNSIAMRVGVSLVVCLTGGGACWVLLFFK